MDSQVQVEGRLLDIVDDDWKKRGHDKSSGCFDDVHVGRGDSFQHLEDHLKAEWKLRDSIKCDVKLHANGKFVRAHRSVLAACSSFLANIFMELDPFQCKELNITFCEVNHGDLLNLIRFLYEGQVTLTQRRNANLQKLLRVLGVRLSLIQTQVNEKGSEEIQDLNSEECQPSSLSKSITVGETEPTREEKSTCQLCKKTFKTESYMKLHLLTHTGEKPFFCDECGKAFRYKDSLQTHMREHTGERLSCEVCLKTFKHWRDLKDHSTVHSGTASFQCNVCSIIFDSNKKLVNHKESHKSSNEPCPHCAKTFKTIASRKAHLRSHSKDKQHSCGTCGRAFKRNFDLKVHLRIHTGEKPYSCNVCQKEFSLTSSLSKHKRSHVKPSRSTSDATKNPKEISRV